MASGTHSAWGGGMWLDLLPKTGRSLLSRLVMPHSRVEGVDGPACYLGQLFPWCCSINMDLKGSRRTIWLSKDA